MPAILTAPPRVFRGRVVSDLAVMRQALDDQRPEGVAEILVAVFDVPDTHPATGNLRVQTIDHGAFRAYLESGPYPEPFFVDHGEAYRDGIHRSTHLAGSVRAGRENDDGLLITTYYNLRKGVGRDAFSDLIHEATIVEFSFGSDIEREQVAVRSGEEHVTEMWPIEYSQVGFGAQELAHLVTARTAIGAHSSDTDDGSWDGPANERRLPKERRALRSAYAWFKGGDADADAKASYKFPHHLVSTDGTVGAASVKGCTSGIGILNGGRGGTGIPDADRQGVWRHLAKHVRDGGGDPTELRAAGGGADMAAAVGSLRHAGAAAGGETSLEALPRRIRESWWGQFELLSRALGGMAIPEEVFGDPKKADRGFVVAAVEGVYRQVPWEITDENEVLFDTRAATELEVQWVEANGSQRSAADAIRTHLPRVLVQDPDFAQDVQRAVQAALEDPLRPANVADPETDQAIRDLYRQLGMAPAAS